MFRGLLLPRSDGSLIKYAPGRPADFDRLTGPPTSRTVYAAAHVVADPLADVDPTSEIALDWEATLAYRRYLWTLGLSVAEAMDTAQRGMGLDWENTKRLIRRSAAEARTMGATIACGAGTDHLKLSPQATLRQVEIAYEEQCEFVETEGGRVILMASRELAALANGAEDYVRVYGRILSQSAQPVILHWLGGAFDPHLEGYWGHRDVDAAMDVCLEIIKSNASKVDGIKISLLDPSREVTMRRRLPGGVRLYTGDDFNYPELIKGDGKGFSHALLGIFDAIAPAAAAALRALDKGNTVRYDEILAPTVPLSRHIFKAPTRFYKTGVVFLAFLNGHQNHFRMVGGLESARSIVHLSELFMLADRAGLISDPERATERMRRVLTLSGIST
jgi:hypothetical protein